MSKNNGMDSQDLDMPSHKYNAKKKISFFFSPPYFSEIQKSKADSGPCWDRKPFVASTTTPCVCNTSNHGITEIINHRNKETDFFWSQKSQVQLCLPWSILSPGIIRSFPVTDRMHSSAQWFSSLQYFDLIFYSQVILFNLLQTFFHTQFRAAIHCQAKYWNVPKGIDEGKLSYLWI